MIETHSHLYADAFTEDIDAVIERCRQVGIDYVLLPNIDHTSIEPMNKLVKRDTTYFKRMMGLHPCSVDDEYKSQLAIIKKELDTKDCIAVGEIGIDLYWDKTKQALQEEAFLMQCQWAVDANLPIAIHSRESTDIIINLLKTHFDSKLIGVFHCFVGNESQALEIVDMGYYLGIGGVVTFKNSDLRNQLVNVPIDRLVLETDSPYLAPVPYRGKRNESAYLVEIVKELSVIYGKREVEIKDITTANALKLFKL